jgi:hypothetical protein
MALFILTGLNGHYLQHVKIQEQQTKILEFQTVIFDRYKKVHLDQVNLKINKFMIKNRLRDQLKRQKNRNKDKNSIIYETLSKAIYGQKFHQFNRFSFDHRKQVDIF